MTDYEKRKVDLEAEYKAMFDRYHQPSGKEAERLDEIVAEWMEIINEDFKNATKKSKSKKY